MENMRKYTLFTTRPLSMDLLEKEKETYDVLERLNIPYTGVHHQAAMTIESLEDVDKFLGVRACKNLFLCNSQKNKFYLLIMPGHKKFVTKNLSQQIKCARLSFADGAFMEEFLNISPGSLSIFGLIFDRDHKVDLIIDKDAVKEEYVSFHPCVNTTTLKIRTGDLMEKFLPYTGHVPAMVEL